MAISHKQKPLPNNLNRLLELKEIVEWQIEIAKCGTIIQERRLQLQEINKKIEQLKEHEQTIKNNAL